MALQYLFDPNKQFQDRSGVNAVNGFLRVYLNGTDDLATTYRNFNGGFNEPDIVFDTDGRAVVIVDDTKTYRLEVYSQTGVLQWTVENYKAQGGSGGGSGTTVSVEGTPSEIDVDENEVGGVKHFIVSLAENVKNAISSLTSAVNGLAISLGNKKERQLPVSLEGDATKTVTVVTQNENGEITVSYSPIAFPDWTSAITAATDLCEKLANKKTSFSGNETSDTFYPTLKAVVDYLDSRLQNLGGKKITNNGQPFTSDSQLPSSTPYYGQNINTDDYAFVQYTGFASRYTATVTGSSVAWYLDYEILLPVFTAEQQDAIDSGVTSTKVGDYDSHIANSTIHVTATDKSTWNGKQDALPTSGTPSSTYAINIRGNANTANRLIRAYVNKSSQTTKKWKKIATSAEFTGYVGASICFLYNHSGYVNELGLDSIVSVSIHSGSGGSLVGAAIKLYNFDSESSTQLLRIGNTNQYEVWVRVPTTDTNMLATVLNSYGDWTINTDDSQTGQLTDDEFNTYKVSNPSVGTSYTYNLARASTAGVGSSSVPVYVDSNGVAYPVTAVGVANGGTGATDAATARSNLGAQSTLPTSGTASSTFAINVSGSANTLPYGRASWNGPSQNGDKKVVRINPTEITYNDVMVTLDIYESVASVGDMFRGKLMIDLRINSNSTYVYNVSYIGKPLLYTTMLVKYDTNSHSAYVIFNKNNYNYASIKAVVMSAHGWNGTSAMSYVTTYNNPDIETTTQYTNVSITYNYICSVKAQVGSSKLPIYANADGSLSPMIIDEYYCWCQPTTQWTDVMENTVWYCQNQCNNEILGSTRRIELTSSHPSLCYLRVMLPELTGAGRYRFTLEFEIKNTSGNALTEAYGVLILVPPTGYSGDDILAECVYDSSGKPQNILMNQIHVPQLGQTTRHKLYVDGHTYRVVKTS